MHHLKMNRPSVPGLNAKLHHPQDCTLMPTCHLPCTTISSCVQVEIGKRHVSRGDSHLLSSKNKELLYGWKTLYLFYALLNLLYLRGKDGSALPVA